MRGIFDLSGRTAVVTGGGTHLGKTSARALATFGAQVHITGRRLEVCEAAAADLRGSGLDVTAHACDASDESAVEEMLASVVSRSGRLDIMLANAGGPGGRRLVPDIPLDQWNETFRLTVVTAMVTAQAAARHMDPETGGRIILVGSIHGFLGADARTYGEGFLRSGSDYHAAKGAVINLARSLACELGPKRINVNCISPGQIPSNAVDPETLERFRNSNPLGITGVAEDIQGAVLLLASDAARFITGQNIVVDGGWSAW
jgi:gluconate 5-dehydrogenase